MTLLNGLLSLGALAFTIPLAIHLLFRARFRTIQWGAMHLLDSVVRINHRRIQLLQLLLLLVRCLLPVLLAFCLARPVLTGFRSLPGDAPASLILAIDDSRSMSARDQTGVTRIGRARDLIQQLLGDLSRQDEVILIRSSQLQQAAIVTGRSDASERLWDLEAESGPVDLALLVQRSIEAIESAAHSQRRIVVVSDFQNQDLGDATIESLRRLGARLPEGKGQPTIGFLNLGVNSQLLDNVSIDLIEAQSPAFVLGREASFTVRIRNGCDLPKRNLRVTWTVNGREIGSTEVEIEARSTTSVVIDHAFEKTGQAEFSVAIEQADAILADNRRAISVDVIDEVAVLIVDGQPSDQPLKGETDFLTVALSPFSFGGVDRADAIRTTVIQPRQIVTTIGRTEPNVLVLANVDQLNDNTKAAIADFVTRGGSLVIFDGSLVRPDSYNSPWQGKLGSWMLPAALGPVVGNVTANNANPIAIDGAKENYTPWRELTGPDGSLFDEVELFGYRRLTVVPPDEANQQPGATTMLSTASGAPLIVSASRGRGRIVQFAFPSDDAWTGLPTRAVFVPMMQQLMLDLAGTQRQVQIQEIPAAESVLQDASTNRLQTAAESVNANVYTDLSSLQTDELTRRYGREIWRWLLVLLLAALVGEVVLQQRLGPGVRSPVSLAGAST